MKKIDNTKGRSALRRRRKTTSILATTATATTTTTTSRKNTVLTDSTMTAVTTTMATTNRNNNHNPPPPSACDVEDHDHNNTIIMDDRNRDHLHDDRVHEDIPIIEDWDWSKAAPSPYEEQLLTIVCGNSNYLWALHLGFKDKFVPSLFWK